MSLSENLRKALIAEVARREKFTSKEIAAADGKGTPFTPQPLTQFFRSGGPSPALRKELGL